MTDIVQVRRIVEASLDVYIEVVVGIRSIYIVSVNCKIWRPM